MKVVRKIMLMDGVEKFSIESDKENKQFFALIEIEKNFDMEMLHHNENDLDFIEAIYETVVNFVSDYNYRNSIDNEY